MKYTPTGLTVSRGVASSPHIFVYTFLHAKDFLRLELLKKNKFYLLFVLCFLTRYVKDEHSTFPHRRQKKLAKIMNDTYSHVVKMNKLMHVL